MTHHLRRQKFLLIGFNMSVVTKLHIDAYRCLTERHQDHATVEDADHHVIKLFFPRIQTTREMQPMEKSVFVPFDHY